MGNKSCLDQEDGGDFCCGGENPFAGLQRGINSLFEQFSREVPINKIVSWGNKVSSGLNLGFTPRVDLVENSQQLILTAELPGIEESQVELSVAKDHVIIRGDKGLEPPQGTQRKISSERIFGRFERIIELSAQVAQDQVSAVFSKGVLTVVMPKLHPTHEHKVNIKVQAE